jgi:hypothetical protein
MEYQDRVVCFLDILGFRERIAKTLKADGTDSPDNIAQLANALDGIREILDIDRPEDRPETEITQFSDSIVISFSSGAESGVFFAVLSILWVQIGLVLRGILCRGGIARGRLIHTPKMLFGPAMVNAYLLESRAALYPRVILDESIIAVGVQAHARHHDAEHERDSIMNVLQKDTDGMYYVNYITAAQSELDDPELDYPNYLLQLRRIIADGLTLKDPSTTIKYRWLREKFEPHLLGIKRNVRRSKEIDPELREAYESIPEFDG